MYKELIAQAENNAESWRQVEEWRCPGAKENVAYWESVALRLSEESKRRVQVSLESRGFAE